MPFKAVDIHAHISTKPGIESTLTFTKALMEYYMKQEVSSEQVLSMAKSEKDMAQDFIAAGVKAFLVGWDAETNTGLPAIKNEYIARLVKDFPDAYAGAFGCVDPNKGEVALQEAEKCMKEHKMLGLKFHASAQAFYPNEKRFYPLWDLCQSLGAIIQFHTGTTGLGAGIPGGGGIHLDYARPMYIDRVAADFPKLKIVLCHPSFPWQDETIAIVIHKSNCFIDLSGYLPKYFPEQLKREIKGRLKDRVMFGSDYPIIPFERLFESYEKEGYTPEILEKVYYKNAEAFLGMKFKEG